MTAPRCTLPPEGAAAAAARAHRAALPRLETARLVLRPPELADLALWTGLHAGPEAAFLGGPLDPRAAFEAFSVYVAGWLLHGHGLWTVERRADGAAIGFVLLGLEWEDAEPELGWAFAAEARGRGYAREAAAAALAHGLALLPRLVSCIEPGNAPSARLAARLGATLDGAESARLGTPVWRHAPRPEAPR